jgi:hypothetical protein
MRICIESNEYEYRFGVRLDVKDDVKLAASERGNYDELGRSKI